MKNIFYIIFILLFITCNENYNNTYEKIKILRINKDHSNAIIELKKLLDTNLNDSQKNETYFTIAEIYLNDIKSYNKSIDYFSMISEKSDFYPKSIFMIGYIYSNNLNEYTKAVKYYNIFKYQFNKHELYTSVLYELELLDKNKSIIDSLNNIAYERKKSNEKKWKYWWKNYRIFKGF